MISKFRSALPTWLGVATAVLVSACSGLDLPTTSPSSSLTAPTADNSQPPNLGYVRVCKVSGPAGTYSFSLNVAGGGDYNLNWGNPLTLDFDGANPICIAAYNPTANDSWQEGETANVTVTENVPAGMSVPEIQVYNPDVPPAVAGMPWGYLYSVYNTPTHGVTVGLWDKRKLHYYNINNPPPPPPVVATCYSVNAVAGVAIVPVQLGGSGGMGGPYTFTGSGLPDGLSVSTSGLLSGTPTVTGSFTYTILVTDNSGNTGTANCSVVVAPPPPPPPPPGGEGCTPGYWKAKSHLDSWAGTGYSPTQKLSTVFSIPTSLTLNGVWLGNYTMHQGLSFQGGSTASGKAEILLRAAVASVLNSSHTDVSFGSFLTTGVIDAVNAALVAGDANSVIALATRLDLLNNAGCPLN